MAFADKLDSVLKLDPLHPCYQKWRQYHLEGIQRGVRLAAYLDKTIGLHGKSVLDVGCGLGGNAIALARLALWVTGLEPNSEAVGLARERAAEESLSNTTFVVGSGERMPFPNNSFDVVVMNDVIEHLQDPPQAISEVARLLRDKGTVYVLAPNRLSVSVLLRDPHYGLPLVVLFPQSVRNAAVRIARKGVEYDGNWFPTPSELKKLFAANHLCLNLVGYQHSGGTVSKPSLLRRIICGYPIFLSNPPQPLAK